MTHDLSSDLLARCLIAAAGLMAPAWPAYADERRPGHVDEPAVSTCRYRARHGKVGDGPLYQCSDCGWQSTKWAGRCGECQSWGTVAQARAPASALALALARTGSRVPLQAGPPVRPQSAAASIADIDATEAHARPTGLGELDRVLGGGLVPGAVVLLAGEPGVGKSTLLLQAGALASAAARSST